MTVTDLAKIQHRRGTALEWSTANTLLDVGEIGYETDTKLSKMGDGVTLWNSLTYQSAQIAAQIHLATGKTTPVGADEFALVDSAAGNVIKKISWTNILATAKAYFDTLYTTAAALASTLTGYIAKTLTTTTGDIIYASAANTPARLGIGTNGYVLGSNGTVPGWVAQSVAGGVLLSTTTLSGASTVISGIDQSYKNLVILIFNIINPTANPTNAVTPNGVANFYGSLIAASSGGTSALTNKNGTSLVGGFSWAGAGANGMCVLTIFDYANTTHKKALTYLETFISSDPYKISNKYDGFLDANNAITSVTCSTPTGSNTGGTVLIYGVN